MSTAWFDEVHDCTKCGGEYVTVPGTKSMDEGDGSAMVGLICSNHCGMHSVYYWTPSDEEYACEFGHPFGADLS